MTMQAVTEAPLYTNVTYESYFRLPRIYGRYEIIDGDLYMSPAPTNTHQWDLSELNDVLKAHVRARKLGIVLFAPLDVLIRKRPKLKTRQPDLLYLSTDRTGMASRRDLHGIQILETAPDLVVEILSPNESPGSRESKLLDYAEIGVAEVWLVSSTAITFEVLTLRHQAYERFGLYGMGDLVRSSVLPDFEMPVDSVFGED